MTLTTLTNPKEVVQTRYEQNITKNASSDRKHKCSKENCDRLLVGEICRVAPSDVLSEAEWIWLIQSVDSFLGGGVLCKGDTDDSSFQWDNIPLFRVFFFFFFVRMRLLHYFPAAWWQGWWARAPGRAAGQENTGCGNGGNSFWWMPCHLCTAPDDTCSISVPRHLLIGQDEISHHCEAVYVHACEWVKGDVRYRLNRGKVIERKSQS